MRTIQLMIKDHDMLSEIELALDDSKIQTLIASASDDSYGIGNLEVIELKDVEIISYDPTNEDWTWLINYKAWETDVDGSNGQWVDMELPAFDVRIL